MAEKKTGQCKDCKHWTKYSDSSMKCAFYGSMPRTSNGEKWCDIDNGNKFGFEKTMDYQTDDIEIGLSNDSEHQYAHFGLFDKLEDKRPIKVASIVIQATTISFFSHNPVMVLGKKKYILRHYLKSDNQNVVAIYDFNGDYLSALKDVVLYPEKDETKFNLAPFERAWITISTVQ